MVRFGSVFSCAIAAFGLLGLVLFGTAPREQPATVARASPIAVEAPPAATVPTDLVIDRVARGFERGNQPPPVILELREPVRWTDPRPELEPLPARLTAGRRAALRLILEGEAYLLYFGAPADERPEPEDPLRTLIEFGPPSESRTRGLRHVSIGDCVDPELEEYVRDFNLQMLHALERGLVGVREVDGLWSAAARLDEDADELLFGLLDDPTDAIATQHDPETGVCELDLGKRDGIDPGMRFLLWTQGRPLRRVLALAEVSSASTVRCQVRILKSFSGSWPAAPGIRASNPFFHRGRKVAGYALGDDRGQVEAAFRGWVHATLYETLQFPDFCIVGDVPEPRVVVGPRLVAAGPATNTRLERARQAGAIFVPERLVPYLLPEK